MIKFENVNVNYVPQFASLLNFSLEFSQNTLFLGDEISGSNTILRLLAGFDKDYSGNIFINNVNLNNIKQKNLNLAFVSKQPYLLNFRSLESNIGYGLKIRKTPKAEIKTTVDNAIKKYNFTFLNKKVKSLNLSQKKMITLLRAAIRKPKILLLEYFFEDLDKNLIPTALKIITDLTPNTLIIACEKQNNNILENFDVFEFNYGTVKKVTE